MKYIFLDDYRIPSDVSWTTIPNVDWTIVRNYNEFVKLIESCDEAPYFIAFDHDLADNHYVGDFSNPNEKTGMDCAKWLVEICQQRKWDIPSFLVHSLNPIGAENITAYLENAKKFMEDDGA